MARLEELTIGTSVMGLLPNGHVTVHKVDWIGSNCIELTYKDAAGQLGQEMLYREDEPRIDVVHAGRPWSFDGDGALFRLAAEAHRIRLAHLFDPLLAVHTSVVEPLPHQISAVYEEMLPRQPLRYLLADDPGAGKTIMAGLYIKELIARGDLKRCLIVCPGSLVDQWQDELWRRFHLPFEILTRATIEESRSGNPFLEKNLVIARLDHLSRNEDVQAKLEQSDWDLIICDEAHKMSASFFGDEIKRTKRYDLGRLLGCLTRHFLLMTATPHNGREADFQLFMALLDGDRFEGRFRDGVHQVDTSDLMRRLVKEKLLKFDGTPLFPERIANTVTYRLSDPEAKLYAAVTEYVREEMNRAERLTESGDGRRGTVVGFALTSLQRRLASSPETIYQSLNRRRERLETRLREEQLVKRGSDTSLAIDAALASLGIDDLDEFEDESPASELEEIEEQVVDQASAARTIAELRTEIQILSRLEELALRVREAGTDRKWEELSRLLQGNAEMFDAAGHRRKLIIFTEHRDTLNYLRNRITALLGVPESIQIIHGGIGREERRKVQEAFSQDKDVLVLLATDAAGEGVNLQRAHLMVNYDLPWNPNRIEQRFGRIHRIGQTEVCHLWNLVAEETREGDVFSRLFEKLETERAALGGQVFDVLGRTFGEEPLRNLLLDAIRYGEQPEVRERLYRQVDAALDRQHLLQLIEDRALVHDSMDVSRVLAIRDEMDRAQALRLQPHFIKAFFLEAFRHLGGSVRERESGRFEISNVPGVIRARDRQIGTGAPLNSRYERITFEKSLVAVQGKPLAEFVCPGHPLIDATIDLILERHRHLLKQGAILVDGSDEATEPRVLVCLEHGVQDGRTDRDGGRRVISQRMQFVEISESGEVRNAGAAPYLDYEPLQQAPDSAIGRFAKTNWLEEAAFEQKARGYAAEHLVQEHLATVRARREVAVDRTKDAVKERLTKEIYYWDNRATDLRLREQRAMGGRASRLNSEMAQRRADELQFRLQARLAELDAQRRVSGLPPVVVGGALIVPARLLANELSSPDTDAIQELDKIAMAAVLQAERALGHEPKEMPHNNPGYDVESRGPDGRLRFIEVKGKAAGKPIVTVSKTQILTALNAPDQFILALVIIGEDGGRKPEVHYVRRPFKNEPDFAAASVNFDLGSLLESAEAPR